MTPSRKEYFYQLSDLSENSHTAEYLVTVIEKNYPKIENVRCVAHSINLIACDIVKEKFRERLLKHVNILIIFFRSSHQANAKLA
ncbi:hypothetical protein RhiirA5_411700 [Rhizophagus irregularis]|uniref:DUF659 domain-containing protein n=1 Tax=Rhizophagus irregularis TaxID=588596 RepID=A0A2N0Q0I3_9GLOM|nr:hypothetical protein RhiirA5_411700 [Rhizophagus irregularis]